MDSAFVLPSKLRLFLACLVVSTLSACAISPGNVSFSGREQSDVKLPVQKGEEIAPENVKVKPITAELIIEMFNAARPSRAVGSAANELPAQASRIDPATQTLNYRLGPGDIISIIVWDHPELTTPAGTFRTAEQAGTVVAEDGTIFYPYVGVIKVAGKTTREVRDLLANKLAKFI